MYSPPSRSAGRRATGFFENPNVGERSRSSDSWRLSNRTLAGEHVARHVWTCCPEFRPSSPRYCRWP
jgi:hypothetical protein